jgi:hypothetical protein
MKGTVLSRAFQLFESGSIYTFALTWLQFEAFAVLTASKWPIEQAQLEMDLRFGVCSANIDLRRAPFRIVAKSSIPPLEWPETALYSDSPYYYRQLGDVFGDLLPRNRIDHILFSEKVCHHMGSGFASFRRQCTFGLLKTLWKYAPAKSR